MKNIRVSIQNYQSVCKRTVLGISFNSKYLLPGKEPSLKQNLILKKGQLRQFLPCYFRSELSIFAAQKNRPHAQTAYFHGTLGRRKNNHS